MGRDAYAQALLHALAPDAGEVGDDVAVGDDPREADLALAVVGADDASRRAHELLDELPRTVLRPVRLGREEAMHLGGVDAGWIVLELQLTDSPLRAEYAR